MRLQHRQQSHRRDESRLNEGRGAEGHAEVPRSIIGIGVFDWLIHRAYFWDQQARVSLFPIGAFQETAA
jgi:hypothetical protein